MMKIFRLASCLAARRVPLLPYLLKAFNRVVFGVVLPPITRVGDGVLFSYQGLGTVVHRETRIGALIGTGAEVLGPVRVGASASIGANAVVLSDVPPYGVAVGVPAKVIRINTPADIPDYHTFD